MTLALVLYIVALVLALVALVSRRLEPVGLVAMSVACAAVAGIIQTGGLAP